MPAPDSPSEHTISRRTMEIAVAAAFVVLALVIMGDNWRIGARWAADGPQAGYFPFYIGLIMLVASAANLVLHVVRPGGEGTFVERSQARQVLQVLVPTIVFVALIAFLGIYVSSAIFIAYFMIRLGRYPLWRALPPAIIVPLVLFLMFEVWFLVPLPKGPLEAALGY